MKKHILTGLSAKKSQNFKIWLQKCQIVKPAWDHYC